MRLQVNGQDRDLPGVATVAEVLERLGLPRSGVAVAVDGEVVRRVDWTARRLCDGAVVEVLTAVQGG